ncbi:MAG: ABC transporter ATP-binding protein [Ignavibacteria bacterium]
MIEVHNLKKIYENGTIALDDISFHIDKGNICGYVGTNGAGKSTTVKILSGILNFNQGNIIIEGLDIKKYNFELKKIIGYVPESPTFFNSITVEEHFDFLGKIRNLGSRLLKQRLSYFGEFFEFSDYLNLAIGQLSKGNKQKVLITSALIHNPDILLFDEPLNGLDATSILRFKDMIKKLAQHNKTILYSSHLLNIVEQLASHIIIIDKGKIVLDKPTELLLQSAEYTNLDNLFKDYTAESEEKEFHYEDVFD